MSDKVTRTESSSAKFQTFEDLEVHKAAREFRKAMYAANRWLPDFEKYELGSQIQRAAVSLTNNMAAGHGRFHYPDQIRFFLNSRGSLEELVDDLNVCLDENYLSGAEVGQLKQEAGKVLSLLNGYLRYLRSRSSVVREGDELASDLIDALAGLPL
jgi:four helix bundle protein